MRRKNSRTALSLTALRWAALSAAVFGKGPWRHAAGMTGAALYLYPTLRRNCQWHGPVSTRFQTPRKEVWLTIDDGPDRESTPEFLETLARFQARASFFVIGKKVDANRSLCREIIAQGHTIENHSATHPASLWWAFPPQMVLQEISQCSESILCATGKYPHFFRPPVGMCSPGVHRAAKNNGLGVIGWSSSGQDGCPRPPTDVVADIVRQITPGSILLLHEGDRPRHRVMTLLRVLEFLHDEKYSCVIPCGGDLR
jgi:peptidoglycan/xylan/chitin deacetylase (PgdA/CDA1 family)